MAIMTHGSQQGLVDSPLILLFCNNPFFRCMCAFPLSTMGLIKCEACLASVCATLLEQGFIDHLQVRCKPSLI